ncbi:hypothetical protein BUALT_Bualt14G0039500 [Buddleja alternifolia]|uniref:F-box domain-containing protein n=1 Tax=Buddleja alternifolia TaxID=168488 RepID=A0AAV6WRP6_9LAMI|nr:hypothetical protein BUALT_Bualt14G0039500 [Buddleja alternifolia]
MQTHTESLQLTPKFSDQNSVTSHGDDQTVTSYLPCEIIQEILSRLPIKSVLRFQIVSKSWNALILEPKFSRVHLNQSKNNSDDSQRRLFLWQSYVSGQRRVLPMDYSDLSIDHSDWKALLPPDEHEVAWKSASMGFSIEQRTGKNCFMVGATSLGMSFGDEFERKWKMKSHPESRYFTNSYLVFRFTENIKSENSFIRHFCGQSYYDHSSEQAPIVQFRPGKGRNGQIAVSRSDGWMEVEMGEFFVTKRDNRDIEAVLLLQTVGYSMRGLIVEGIEFRPSET